MPAQTPGAASGHRLDGHPTPSTCSLRCPPYRKAKGKVDNKKANRKGSNEFSSFAPLRYFDLANTVSFSRRNIGKITASSTTHGTPKEWLTVKISSVAPPQSQETCTLDLSSKLKWQFRKTTLKDIAGWIISPRLHEIWNLQAVDYRVQHLH